MADIPQPSSATSTLAIASDAATRLNNDSKHLTRLPTEIYLVIFEHLDPVSSACFGITCKKFYPIHYKKHPKVPLHARYDPKDHREQTMLYYLLEKWAAKANLAIAVFGPVVFVPTGMRWWRPTRKGYCNKKGCMWHDAKNDGCPKWKRVDGTCFADGKREATGPPLEDGWWKEE